MVRPSPLDPGRLDPDDHRPARPQHLRQHPGQDRHRVLGIGGDRLDQLPLAVPGSDPGIGPDRLDPHSGHGLRGGDQHIRLPAGRQRHDDVVHRLVGRTLDDVHREDVGVDQAQRGRHGAQCARPIRKQQAQYI